MKAFSIVVLTLCLSGCSVGLTKKVSVSCATISGIVTCTYDEDSRGVGSKE